MLTISELIKALKVATQYLEWDRELIEDFHAYSHIFHAGRAGANVFGMAFEDALRSRGLTLAQFRELRKKGGG